MSWCVMSCTTTEQKEELLAKQYCSSCHQFPEPSLLDKETWTHVMPQMGLRMGVDISSLMTLSEEDYPYVVQTLPRNPMISVEDFAAIARYYQRTAPDSLVQPPLFETQELTQFDVEPMQLLHQRPTITMLRADTARQRFFLSTRRSVLFEYDYQFNRIDSTQLTSPASSIVFRPSENVISLMGIMDPNDQPKGSVGMLSGELGFKKMIDSLKRPVFIEQADLNNDQREDLVVCAFGNFGGALLAFENLGNGNYAKHVISALPGARKVVLKDFTNDGLKDVLVLFSQGDEQISLYTNAGNMRFRVNTLLSFPPVYGSSYFDLTDFNGDGHWDIVYTNGDNADYSIIPKPYHGVRVFLNNGKNSFREILFQQLYGCSMAMARDFDRDGDIDIAAISFFPDFMKTPERSFVYFENDGGNLKSYTTPLAARGRWLLMEPIDLDADGYLDLVLGALDFDTGIPPQVKAGWDAQPVDLLVLRNKAKK